MNKLNLSLMILGMSAFSVFSQTEKINLSGDWSYKLDPQDKGVGEAWFNDELPGSLKLPGSLNTNGVGDDDGGDGGDRYHLLSTYYIPGTLYLFSHSKSFYIPMRKLAFSEVK